MIKNVIKNIILFFLIFCPIMGIIFVYSSSIVGWGWGQWMVSYTEGYMEGFYFIATAILAALYSLIDWK